MSKGSPIPVRFEALEAEALEYFSQKTGLTVAELIRRSVRLFHREALAHGVGALLEMTAPPSRTGAPKAGGLSYEKTVQPFPSARAAEQKTPPRASPRKTASR